MPQKNRTQHYYENTTVQHNKKTGFIHHQEFCTAIDGNILNMSVYFHYADVMAIG